jgi:hypothetical protein
MDAEPTTPDDRPTSRRRLLGALAGGAAGAVAVDLLRPQAAGAADGANAKLGQLNQSDNPTRFSITTANPAIWAESNADDGSVVGVNTAADGYGMRATGAYIGMDAIGGEIGTSSSSDYGVAVLGATYDGVALKGTTSVPQGWALQTEGPVRFSTAGRATIPAGKDKVVLSGLPITASTMVLATPQTRRKGIYVEAVVPNTQNGTATVYLNAATPAALVIGWFVIG